ncbi:hypothetical protein PG991_000030 [Apiospora marii]|uniref:Uncharacterized protein n=1 Tax=Apiospora marii TaxID=335849 RepID=A0ABR1T0X7_9PEZI
MAYADRTTAAMSPLADKWYDTVRTRVLGNRPDPAKKQHLEGIFFKHQAGVLLGFANGGLPPSVSADIFRWNVARATWKHQVPDEPFPHEDEKPPTYGVPCCEQWVRKWYMEMQDRKNTEGPRTTISSSPSATTVEQRTILANRVRPAPMVAEEGCEPLVFPLPRSRHPDLCLGPKENIEQTLVEAANILGHEFTLSCSFGGNQAMSFTLGLAPSVDANDERVLARARVPVDWIEDWWVNALERDTNLLAHLQLLTRQRFTRSFKDASDRIAEVKAKLRFVKPTGALMTESEAIRAHEYQHNELDRIALSVVTREIGNTADCMRRGELLVKFVEKGHPEVHVLNRDDRLRVVQSLVRQNAVDFVKGLVSDSQSAEKKSARLNVVEKVWSELLDHQNLDTKLVVRDMLLSWHRRLPQEVPLPSAAGSVATGAPTVTSTARPGPDPNSPGAW